MKIYYVEYWLEHSLAPTYEFFSKKKNAESFIKKLEEKYGYALTASLIYEAKIKDITKE